MSDPEKTVYTHSNNLASYLSIEPPLDNFEQYVDICAAVYGSIHGEETYRRLPQPQQSDFENSLFTDTTELRFLKKSEYQLEQAGKAAVKALEEKHGIKAVYETAAEVA